MANPTNYVELEDNRLLESIANKGRGSLEALYTRYSGPVHPFLLRDPGRLGGGDLRTFFNVWRRGGSYKSNRGSVTAWLFTIAHHRAIDELRKRRRDQTRI